MITVQTEIAEKVACICCGAEKYATQSPYLCHNCWKNGEAAKLIQQLTQRALDGLWACENCGDWLENGECKNCESPLAARK